MDLSCQIMKIYNAFVDVIYSEDISASQSGAEIVTLTEIEEQMLENDFSEDVMSFDQPKMGTLSEQLRDVSTDINNFTENVVNCERPRMGTLSEQLRGVNTDINSISTTYKSLADTEHTLRCQSIEDEFDMIPRVTVNMAGVESSAVIPSKLPQRKNISIQIN